MTLAENRPCLKSWMWWGADPGQAHHWMWWWKTPLMWAMTRVSWLPIIPETSSARSSSLAPAIATSSKASLWTGQDFPLCPCTWQALVQKRWLYETLAIPDLDLVKGKDMWLDKPQPLHQTEPLKQSVQWRMPGCKEQLVHLTPTPLASLSKAQKDILDVEAMFMSECTALLSRRSGFGGFLTVASARALHQPTSCGSSISIINVHKFGT